MIENEVIVDFLSGFTAGFAAVTCCAPLELIRTRFSLMVPFFFLLKETLNFLLRIDRISNKITMGAFLKPAEQYITMRAFWGFTKVFSNEFCYFLLFFFEFYGVLLVFYWKLGYKVTAAATPIFHSLFFAIYNYAKIFNRKLLPNHSENYLLINSLSSSIAGISCNCITNPLWVFIFLSFSLIFYIFSLIFL